MIVDYHVHSKNSHDGQNTMEELCESAIRLGINEIAFTEHYDAGDSLYYGGHYNCNSYFENIKKAIKRFGNYIAIKSAVEIADVLMHRNVAANFIKQNHFDYVLLAVHYIAFDNMWFLDYNKLKINEGIVQYYTNLKDNILCFDDFDCIAHFDLPKRYLMRENILANMNDYLDYAHDILKIIIEKGKGIEVNSSTMRNNITNEPMPSFSILKMYKELGGEIITVGSDAHRAEDVGKGVKNCIEIIKEAGFKYIITFNNRTPIFNKIN